MSTTAPGKILVVEHDAVTGDLLYAVLTDEGYDVEVLGQVTPDAIRVAVGRFEPDCVILDAASPRGYGASWGEAAWLSGRSRHVPAVMLTSHSAATDEAAAQETTRSRDAAFAAIVPKPFELDDLLAAVGTAVGESAPFDTSRKADTARTAVLVQKLREAGAHDVRPSNRREWASFQGAGDVLLQLYWWQRDGVYYVIRFAATGGRVDRVGRVHDLDTAIALAMAVHEDTSTE